MQILRRNFLLFWTDADPIFWSVLARALIFLIRIGALNGLEGIPVLTQSLALYFLFYFLSQNF